MDPNSKLWKHTCVFICACDKEGLTQLAEADIKFVSPIAKQRLEELY